MSRIALTPTLLALTVALALAGCGGDGGGDGGSAGGGYGGARTETTAITAAPNPEEGAVFVSVAAVPGLGRVLVDSSGRTLYAFAGDGASGSACDGGCAEAWPPLLSDGDPHASNGAIPDQLGTTERGDGTTQVTYAGHPLYTHAEDREPGDANGNGADSFGGSWFALAPSGASAG